LAREGLTKCARTEANLNLDITLIRIVERFRLLGATVGVLGALSASACAQPAAGSAPQNPGGSAPETVVYEQGPTGPLTLVIWGAGAPGPSRPVVVLFHGGGFTGGDATQFSKMCEDIASQAITCASVNYALGAGDQEVHEARDAVAWVRGHATQLNIAPDHVIVGGGSAGGYLALSTAVLAPDRNSMPNALVLFNPVLVWHGAAAPTEDLTGGASRPLPPMVFFHGTADQTAPYANIQAFVATAKSTGSHAELESFPGRQHGFFNYGGGNNPDYFTVTKSVIEFVKTGQVG